MVRAIQHRGVNEQGVTEQGPAVFGSARLIVVDLAHGSQPMSNAQGTVWVVFNGGIFNFVELRAQLVAKGYRFQSQCDTEVLVHLWCERGEKMLDDLIGMFAFFLWDTRSQTGLLARDRQGIKPLFYAAHGGGLAFASEIKGLLALPGFERRVNEQALGEVFSFNYCPPPETCFEGVLHLPAGHFMRVAQGRFSPPQAYWRWPLGGARETPNLDEFEALLDDAIRMQVRYDVPGGLFLSGGVDSSVVAARLVRQWGVQALHAVGLRIDEPGFSEFAYAEQAAQQLGIRLHAMDVRATDIPAIADDVVRHVEQPNGDFSYCLFYLMCRSAHQAGKVVMFNGDGPDEALLGYRHNAQYFSGQARPGEAMAGYFDLISYSTAPERARLMSTGFLPYTQGARARFEAIIQPWRELSPPEQAAAYELHALGPGSSWIKGDRMGARWSIEGRAPLLDHRVSELLARLPLEQKLGGGIGKLYLKRMAARYYGDDFGFRPKTMPTLPIGEWIKGPLYPWAREVLALPDGGRFNPVAVQALLEEHRSGAHNHTRLLRTLLTTKLWLRAFFPVA